MQVELADTLTDRDLRALAQLVYARAGISLHEGKRALVTARLQKRVRAVGFDNFGDYVRFVETDATGDEVVALLDAISTNHTSFYREPQHFALLAATVAPGVGPAGLDVWSAACSSGEEPYTIAMTMADALGADPAGSARIFASDLSTKVLQTARSGVYKLDRLEGLSRDVLKRHFEKGMGAQAGLARVQPHLQAAVTFERLNLIEIGDLGRRFDVIFCRNVMIYFDKPVQQKVVSMLERHLKAGGWLFISHSESLNGIEHDLQWVAPAVYRRKESR